jgi:hypothetical protein
LNGPTRAVDIRGGDAARSRHALGQWFTSPAVADLALALALRGMDVHRRGFGLLDPACGDGVFLARARAAGVPASALCGVEVDPRAAAAARAAAPGARVDRADLFGVAAPPRGFDVVVGNPPYVRQERRTAVQKRTVRARLAADWPHAPPADLDRLAGRGDLAGACVARALRLAAPGGRVALVVSSALLDAGYGEPLWRLVTAHARVIAIVDAPGERWFADAAINPIIILLERGGAGRRGAVALARLRAQAQTAARRLAAGAELADVADVRHGESDERGASRWAELLRAPPAWFDLRATAGDALVPLGALARVRRGITSGANDIFYLSRARARELGLERALLAPLVRAPRERAAAAIAIDPASTPDVALVCPPDPDALARHPAARRYVDDHAAAAARPTLRNRRPWWALPARRARLFLTKAYSERFIQRLASAPVVADQRVYAIEPAACVDAELLAAVLNSTFTALALESLGRASMGEGALEWTVDGARDLPVLDPRQLSQTQATSARAALVAFAQRPIGRIAHEVGRDDRIALDSAVAAAAGGIGASRDELAAALAASVERRLARARLR